MTIVGIDLGTTHSAIGVFEGERVRLFPNPLGDVLTPSAIAIDGKRRGLIVGRTAKDVLAVHPEQGAARFKIDMGRATRYRVGERELDAIELSAHVLDALRADAERALGTPVTRCVITVPAYFDDAQRAATRRAAEIAGFAVERILNEPTAAAIAYGLHKRADESLFGVVDLGGGTFDVCVMELFEGVLQVKGVAGESRLGGEDFTDALAGLLARKAGVAPPAPGTLAAALLTKRAELTKRALARWTTTEVTLAGEITGGAPARFDISVDEADAIWAPLIDRLHAPMRAALRGAGVEREALADVILVGGATRMPCVQRAIAEAFGRPPIHHADPDLLVAEGAAIQAAMLANDAAVGDLVVTDVASHSLGVDSSREVGGRMVDGYFVPVIHRNTTIPCSRWESFATLENNQKHVLFRVYEGESRRAKDNRQIGELRVEDLPRGPAPKEVRVRFTYDANGMLEVEALVPETKQVVTKVFTREGGELVGAALEAARARLRALRADPLERPRYRDLLARANLLWAEADPAARGELSLAIDACEAAAADHQPQAIDRAFAALEALCVRIDRGVRW
ncbi:MAG: Hsp70 family protein [Deltaproteobacteria bacterium]|nr:Hsp70 family protein [Deltaproteobacteria bacterium]